MIWQVPLHSYTRNRLIFGVCYYPEHWPRSMWRADAALMQDLGLTYVRIGEFAWSRLEPRDGDWHFDWLDEAIQVLAAAGLQIVMGTPTATPPKWLVDKYPDILPVDPDSGRTRGFGSRRHYDFSSDTYRNEALRITEVLARRYGRHDAVVGWQTDNELCCHDTALSASPAARSAFQDWCRHRYPSIDALNTAWGNVFWSMEYQEFANIELPVGAVTETNPAHRLAYRRFSSDQVVDFHNRMIAVIRQHAPGKFITHNFIPMVDTGVDNHALAAELDFASYDNYPLGRTDIQFRSAATEQFRRYMRTGHPDFSTYSFDQVRGLRNAGFWVMEQQPGPVNWADNNPRPAPGMIRLWTLEAFAHGAECVAYFRWRQAPFAQEQMHAGLLRPDNSKSAAWPEIQQAIAEAEALSICAEVRQQAPVAIINSPESYWVADIERQSEAYEFDNVQFAFYQALRALGICVDFIDVDSDLDGYRMIVAPCLPIIDDAFVDRCAQSDAMIIFGPRSGSKTDEFGYPMELPPGPLQRLAPVRVLSVETLRPDCTEALLWQQQRYDSLIWREELEAPGSDILATYAEGGAAVVRYGRIVYIGTLTCHAFLRDFFAHCCEELAIDCVVFGDDIRVVRRGDLNFAFNYSSESQELPLADTTDILLGDRTILPRDVTVWRN